MHKLNICAYKNYKMNNNNNARDEKRYTAPHVLKCECNAFFSLEGNGEQLLSIRSSFTQSLYQCLRLSSVRLVDSLQAASSALLRSKFAFYF